MTQAAVSLALAGFGFMLTVIWGPPLLRILRHFKVGKAIRVEGPERHFSKLGTPTMGGIMIILRRIVGHVCNVTILIICQRCHATSVTYVPVGQKLAR